MTTKSLKPHLFILAAVIAIHFSTIDFVHDSFKQLVNDVETAELQLKNAAVLYARQFQHELQHDKPISINGETLRPGTWLGQASHPTNAHLQTLGFLPNAAELNSKNAKTIQIERYPTGCQPDACYLMPFIGDPQKGKHLTIIDPLKSNDSTHHADSK